MGEAKRRGTKQERQAVAVETKIEEMGMYQMTMDSICSQFDITEGAIPMGYIIRINYDDELEMRFLSSIKRLIDRIDLSYSFNPGDGCCFENENFDELANMARFVAKNHKTDICYLFQTESQYEVVPVITVDSPNISKLA